MIGLTATGRCGDDPEIPDDFEMPAVSTEGDRL